VPAGAIEYVVVLALGVVTGLLVRYLVAVGAVVGAGFATLWLLGYADSSVLTRAFAAARDLLASLPWGSQTLFTLVGATFVLGLLLGVLLTTRVRLLDARAVG